MNKEKSEPEKNSDKGKFNIETSTAKFVAFMLTMLYLKPFLMIQI